MVTASTGVQTVRSKVVHSCRSICHSSEPQSFMYVSPVPYQHAWDIDALNINWSGLTAYAYPPTALLHRVIKNQAMQLPHLCNSSRLARDALFLGPGAALNRDPTLVTRVNNTSQTVSQPSVSQQSTTSQPPRLVLGVDRSNKASLWKWQRELLPLKGHQQGPSTSPSGPYLRNVAETIRWISPLPLLNKSQTFLCTCIKT